MAALVTVTKPFFDYTTVKPRSKEPQSKEKPRSKEDFEKT